MHDTVCLAHIMPCAGPVTRLKMERVWPRYCGAAGACCAGVALSGAFLLWRVCLAVRPCARARACVYTCALAAVNAPEASEINVSEASGAPIGPVEVEIPPALAAVNAQRLQRSTSLRHLGRQSAQLRLKFRLGGRYSRLFAFCACLPVCGRARARVWPRPAP